MVSNKLLVAVAAMGVMGCSLSTLAQPTYGCPGIYIGAQAGWGHVNYKGLSDAVAEAVGFSVDSSDKDGIAGRAYLGYQFNQYVGIETGFAAFSEVDVPYDFGDILTTQWDLLLRVGMPFGDTGFRGDVKAGAAYVYSKYDASSNAESFGLDDERIHKIKPAAGASISYSFCSNISIDASYLHAFGSSDNDWAEGDRGVPSTDLVTIGVSYLFPIL